MRLFHISEEPNIQVFEPRKPLRKDLDQAIGLVWAIDERRLPNFLTPRNCPRVCYHPAPKTTNQDFERLFSSEAAPYVVALEAQWKPAMETTRLYLYEFATTDFELQDECAGYYIAQKTQVPISVTTVDSPLQTLFERGVEVRFLPELQTLAKRIQGTSVNWSLCRMAFAKTP